MKNAQIVTESNLQTKNKFDLVLCLLMEKRKVAWLGDSKIVETKKQRKKFMKDFEEEIEEIEQLLNNLNFVYENSGLEVEEYEEDEELATVSFSILTGKTEEHLSEFIEADQTDDHRKTGSLLGYPQTAVDKFKTDQSLNFENFFPKLPRKEKEKLRSEELLHYLSFQPSIGHWEEELNEVRRIRDLIKEETPQLYEEIVNSEINFADVHSESKIDRIRSWFKRILT